MFDTKKTTLGSLKEIFNHVDTDGSGRVDDREFEMCINTFGLFLPKCDQTTLFNHLDADGSGNVGYNELVDAMLPPLEGARAAIVDDAWASLGGDELSSADVCTLCDPSKHPHVVTGDWPVDKVTDFILTNMASNVDKESFVDYYANYSACIPEIETEFFTDMLGDMYGVRVGGRKSFNEFSVAKLAAKLSERVKPTLSEMQILQRGWSYYDTDESYDVTSGEFRLMMEQWGFPLTDAELDAACDTYGTRGRVQWDKFAPAVGAHFGGVEGLFTPSENR